MKACPSCGGTLTEKDAELDMHLAGYGACGNSFPTDFYPWDDEDFQNQDLVSDSDHFAG